MEPRDPTVRPDTVPLVTEATVVHPTAVVESGARIGPGVRIGPHCVVSAGAEIGRGTVLENHVTIMGEVRIGERNRIFPNCVIGGEPQDISYRGTSTRVEIGDDNVIREGVTINRASEKEEGLTSIGNANFLMACCHIAHDCRIGDHVIIANGTLLGGHVRVQSRASLSGAVAVHHWATIGGWSFVAGLSRVLHDVPPFMLCEGLPARPRCIWRSKPNRSTRGRCGSRCISSRCSRGSAMDGREPFIVGSGKPLPTGTRHLAHQLHAARLEPGPGLIELGERQMRTRRRDHFNTAARQTRRPRADRIAHEAVASLTRARASARDRSAAAYRWRPSGFRRAAQFCVAP